MKREKIYYIDAGCSRVYIHMRDENTAQCRDKITTIPEARIEDALAVLREIGLNVGVI